MPDSGGLLLELELAPGDQSGGPSNDDIPTPSVTLEFLLVADDLSALARVPGMQRAGSRQPVRLVWHDDAGRSLTAAGLSLCRDGPEWRLERLAPGEEQDWPICRPPPPLSHAPDPGRSLSPARTRAR